MSQRGAIYPSGGGWVPGLTKTVSTDYTVLDSDNGYTITLDSDVFFTVTFSDPADYSDAFEVVFFIPLSSSGFQARAKWLSGAFLQANNTILWPGTVTRFFKVWDTVAAAWVIRSDASGVWDLGFSLEVFVDESAPDIPTDGLDSSQPFKYFSIAFNTYTSLVTNVAGITFNIADSTITDVISVSNGWRGTGAVYIRGNTTTPGNVVITTDPSFTSVLPGNLSLEGVRLTGTDALLFTGFGNIYVSNIEIATSSRGMVAVGNGANIIAQGPVKLDTALQQYFWAGNGGNIKLDNQTIDINSAVNCYVFFWEELNGSVSATGVTYTNNFNNYATAYQYSLTGNSSLFTNGALAALPAALTYNDGTGSAN